MAEIDKIVDFRVLGVPELTKLGMGSIEDFCPKTLFCTIWGTIDENRCFQGSELG